MRRLLALTVATVSLLLSLTVAVVIVEARLRMNAASKLYQEAGRRVHPFLQVLPDDEYIDGLNSERFRGDPITLDKAPGTLRVFTLGGSTTLGIANTYRESYPYQLQALLSEKYPGRAIEVQNAGVDWYATPHILINYELRVRRFHPDVVVVFEGINDLYRGFSPPWLSTGAYRPDYSHYLGPLARIRGPAFGAFTPPRSRRDQWLVWHKLMGWFAREPDPLSADPAERQRLASSMKAVPVDTFRSLETFRSTYELLIRTMQADGVKVLVSSQPFIYKPQGVADEQRALWLQTVFCAENGTYPDLPSMSAGMRRFNATAREVAEARGAAFVDAEAAVPKSLEFFSDDVHLTAKGNERVARSVFEALVQSGFVAGK